MLQMCWVHRLGDWTGTRVVSKESGDVESILALSRIALSDNEHIVAWEYGNMFAVVLHFPVPM